MKKESFRKYKNIFCLSDFSGTVNFCESSFFSGSDFLGTEDYCESSFNRIKFFGNRRCLRIVFFWESKIFTRQDFCILGPESFCRSDVLGTEDYWRTCFFLIGNRNCGGSIFLEVEGLRSTFLGNRRFLRIQFLHIGFIGKRRFLRIRFWEQKTFASQVFCILDFGEEKFFEDRDFADQIFWGDRRFFALDFVWEEKIFARQVFYTLDLLGTEDFWGPHFLEEMILADWIGSRRI